jgi:hypothetical protein
MAANLEQTKIVRSSFIRSITAAMQNMMPNHMHRTTKAALWSIPIVIATYYVHNSFTVYVPHTLTEEWKYSNKLRTAFNGMNKYGVNTVVLASKSDPVLSDEEREKLTEAVLKAGTEVVQVREAVREKLKPSAPVVVEAPAAAEASH